MSTISCGSGISEVSWVSGASWKATVAREPIRTQRVVVSRDLHRTRYTVLPLARTRERGQPILTMCVAYATAIPIAPPSPSHLPNSCHGGLAVVATMTSPATSMRMGTSAISMRQVYLLAERTARARPFVHAVTPRISALAATAHFAPSSHLPDGVRGAFLPAVLGRALQRVWQRATCRRRVRARHGGASLGDA